MRIVVCVNYIPDPEAPAKKFRLDPSTKRPLTQGANFVIGPFDENALEVALQLRDSVGARVTALTIGPAANADALKRALAVRCDDAIQVKEDRAVELDSAGVSTLLAAAIRRVGSVDLVLCGRQVGDWDGGQVGQLLAEELGFACITLARKVEPVGDRAVKATKEIPGGTSLLEAQLPALATITNAWTNQLRVANVRDVMAAKRAPITAWTAAELGIDMDQLVNSGRILIVQDLTLVSQDSRVELVDGDSDEQKAERLTQRLLAMKVL